MTVDVCIHDPDFIPAIVTARRVNVGPTPPALAAEMDQLVSRRATEDFPPAAIKDPVRRMLRNGGFKPSGRNKPASEYLAQAAREGRFPRINNLVDVNNLMSLESGLPISMLDLDVLGSALQIRYGLPGQRYVFNSAGQEIDLQGLICIGRVGGDLSFEPLGSPIKDSMAGKLKDHTTAILAITYVPRHAITDAALTEHQTRFAQRLRQYCGATETHILSPG